MKFKRLFVLALLAATALFLFSCTKDAPQSDPQSAAVPQIIIDADLGSSTDDLFAMQLVYRAAAKGQCNLLGVVVDRMGDTNAAVADLMNTYYGFPNLPLALEQHGPENPNVYINYTPMVNFQDADGQPLFARTYSDYSSLPDGWQLYRRLLAAAPDSSVVILATGFLSSLAHLMTSTADQYSPLNGVELVSRKVKRLYFMGTKLTTDEQQDVSAGYNIKNDINAAITVFNNWPSDGDIILSPSAVGDTIEYVPDLVVSDISWTDRHPIKQVYMNYDCNTGQRMWDAVLTLQVIEGDDLFTLSPRGHLTVKDNKRADFTPAADGNCRYQIMGDEAWRNRVLALIRASN